MASSTSNSFGRLIVDPSTHYRRGSDPNVKKLGRKVSTAFEPSFCKRLAWKNGSDLFRFPDVQEPLRSLSG